MERDKIMKWPNVDEFLRQLQMPESFEFKQLESSDIDCIITKLPEWYPAIIVGQESTHLDASYFHSHAFLKNGDPSKDVLPLKCVRGENIVGLLTIKRDVLGETITAPMGVADPVYRSLGLGSIGQVLLEKLGREIGASLAYFQATLAIPHQQAAAEKNGYMLIGIIPAADRDQVSPGVSKRVFEAIYAKVLCGSDDIHLPSASALTEQTKRMWDFLFQGTSFASVVEK
jgi:hypothetical protein